MRVLRVLVASVISLFVIAAPAHAAMDIFLCSASIPGEANDEEFNGCNGLLAVGERIIFLAEGANRPENSVDLLPIEIRKRFDLSSPIIRMLALTKQPFDAVVKFRRISERPFLFLEIRLQAARIVNVRLDTTGEDVFATEAVTILPGQVTWTYTPQNSDGSPGEATGFSYDVDSGEPF